jgi:hypothetical protein
MAKPDWADDVLSVEKTFAVPAGKSISIRLSNPTPTLTSISVHGAEARHGLIHINPPEAGERRFVGMRLVVDPLADPASLEPVSVEILEAGTVLYRDQVMPTRTGKLVSYGFLYGESIPPLVLCPVDGWVRKGACPHT